MEPEDTGASVLPVPADVEEVPASPDWLLTAATEEAVTAVSSAATVSADGAVVIAAKIHVVKIIPSFFLI